MGAHAPYWGSVTASVNWCEPDYVYTPYIAEWWNTLTSFPIFALALYGFFVGLRQGYSKRVLAPLLLMAVVGFGSMAFHGTLQKWGQAIDELAMIWAAAALHLDRQQAELAELAEHDPPTTFHTGDADARLVELLTHHATELQQWSPLAAEHPQLRGHPPPSEMNRAGCRPCHSTRCPCASPGAVSAYGTRSRSIHGPASPPASARTARVMGAARKPSGGSGHSVVGRGCPAPSRLTQKAPHRKRMP
jgi:hypothetical protein